MLRDKNFRWAFVQFPVNERVAISLDFLHYKPKSIFRKAFLAFVRKKSVGDAALCEAAILNQRLLRACPSICGKAWLSIASHFGSGKPPNLSSLNGGAISSGNRAASRRCLTDSPGI
ncbi:MAG: hypothetical protein WBD16_09200 [Pyrinomonadaceae bacterium]